MQRHSVLRKIYDLQLRFPELHASRLNISDLFEESIRSIKRESDKDYIYAEWLQMHKVMALSIKPLREVFLSYNLNYLQRKTAEFTPESSHLERAFKMQFATFKRFCKDMHTTLDEFTLMRIYYVSTRPYKVLPCTFLLYL